MKNVHRLTCGPRHETAGLAQSARQVPKESFGHLVLAELVVDEFAARLRFALIALPAELVRIFQYSG